MLWQQAARWLWKQRRHAPSDADIRDLRFHRESRQDELFRRVVQGDYRLKPMLCYRTQKNERVMQWAADDALVLKWLALQADGRLPVHERCEHRKHGGGARASVRRLQHAIQNEAGYRFVYRTDIRGYYRHIRKPQAYAMFCRCLPEPVLQDLFRQYLYYSVEDGGEIHSPENGSPRGCSLSPQVGASLLYHCDDDSGHQEEIYYARYMDDFMVLTKTRWHLRRSIRRLNDYLDTGGFSVHPDKTYIGRLRHGFDWLGVSFDETGSTGLSERAIKQHRERCLRLYEQACRRGLTGSVAREHVQAYRTRWKRWGRSMLAV
ncbi:TPA: reverse transcriptase domain-containing protein [Salmonella enterica subsp. diarizonae]